MRQHIAGRESLYIRAMIPAFSTERLTLEPLSAAHADEMHAVLADTSLHVFIGGEPLMLGALRARYERLARGSAAASGETWINLIVRVRDSGQAIGTVQATLIELGEERVAKLAWVIGVEWQGKGFATEAARALVQQLRKAGVRCFQASVHADHIASQRVAAHLGLMLTDLIDDGEQVWRAP